MPIARRLGVVLMVGWLLAGCGGPPPPPSVDNPAWRYTSGLEHDADVMIVYLKSLRTFPPDPSAPAPRQTATAEWIDEIRQQAKFMATTQPASGMEDLAARYQAVGHDIEHALDLYAQGSPDSNKALKIAVDELADARRTAGNILASMLGGESPPFHIPTPTPLSAP